MKNVDLIVDMQFGSTGKGLIAGYLAKKNKYDVVVNANMPNAGHTFIDRAGNKMVHKVLPSGAVSPNVKYILIGPGSVFDIDRLMEEIEQALRFGYMADAEVMIHPMAVPLSDGHRGAEILSSLSAIGSTQQGSAAAMLDKINREVDGCVIARDRLPWLAEPYGIVRVVDNDEYNNALMTATNILAEGAQGFSLGINEQFYPYCTSRDCGTARFLSDMGIPVHMLRKVIGTARTYPIRVGGTSGSCYSDQHEINWSDIGIEPETTTVTGRERRIFTFSAAQIREASWAMSVDEVFLNFCNYVKEYQMQNIINQFPAAVKYTGWGPAEDDVCEI